MRNYKIVKTIKDSNGYSDSDFVTTINSLIKNISNSTISSNNTNFDTTVGSIETNTNDENSDILYDTGQGRISTGMRSLRSLSLVISGKVESSIRQTVYQIKYSTPNIFKTASKELSREIVLKNLSIFDIITPLADREIELVDLFLLLIDNIVVDIKQGNFSINKYKRDVLIRIKKIIQLSTNLFNRGKL